MSRRVRASTREVPAVLRGAWPWIAGIVAYLAFLFRDLLSGSKVLFYRDHLMVYLPRDASFRAAMAEGTLPLWEPLFLGGQPFAANPGRQVFYPPHLLVLLGDLPTGYALFILFHVLVAALGMFALVRFAGGSWAAATLGAITLGLSGPYLSTFHLLPTLCAISWMPWIARFTEGFLRSRRPLEFLAAVMALAMLTLGGDPVQAPLTGALMMGWCVARQRYDDRKEAIRAALRDGVAVVGIGVSALLVSSVQLWLSFDFARDTVRVERMSFEMVSHWSFPPARALELLFPAVFETIAPGYLYPSTGGEALLVSVYLGFVTCVLVIAAFAIRMRGAGWMAAAVMLIGLLAIGSHTPLLRFLYDMGLPSLRYPEKLILPVVVLLVMWSALAFERLREGDGRLLRWVVGVGCVAVVVSLGFLLARSPLATAAARQASSAYWLKALVVAIVSVGLLAAASRSRSLVAPVLLIAFVALVDLGSSARRWTPAMPAALLEAPRVTESLDADKGSYRILNDAASQFLDYGDPEGRAWFKAIDLLLHRNGMFPLSNGIWGYASVLEWDTEHTALMPTKDFQSAMYEVRNAGVPEWTSMFASMANARYTTAFRPIGSAQLSGNTDALSIRPVDFIRIGDAPRYYFATSLRRARNVEEFIAGLREGGWAKGSTWVDLEPFDPARGEVLTVDESRHRIVLSVRAEGRAYLNIAITPHRYWSASIDGEPTALHVTNAGFQGLEVPPGEHTIELRYRNPVIVPALAVSLLVLVALVAGTWVMERRRTRAIANEAAE